MTPKDSLTTSDLSSTLDPHAILEVIPLNSLEFIVGWQSHKIPIISLIGKVSPTLCDSPVVKTKILPR